MKNSINKLIYNKEILKILSDKTVKRRYKKAILNSADKSLIKAIEESVYNLLKGNLNYSQDELNQLSKSIIN